MDNIHIVTHDGKFHPDEVYACVLLSWFKDSKLRITRTRDESKLNRYKNNKDVYVIDVGGEYRSSLLNFDHHQSSFTKRNSKGTTLSSCGLIYDHLSYDVNKLPRYIVDKLSSFVDSIDKHDNGIEYFKEVEFVSLYNGSKYKDRFMKAFKVAYTHFENLMSRWYEEHRIALLEDEIMGSNVNGILYCDEPVSVTTRMNFNSKAKLLVTKRGDNEYTIKSLNKGTTVDFSVRCPAPSNWLGLSGHALELVSKFDGMVFCHKAGFLTIVKGTKDHAMEVANYIVESQPQNKYAYLDVKTEHRG